MTPDPTYIQIEQSLFEWASAREDVRAVVVIGSRARGDHPPDRWSDLDAIVFVDDWRPYMEAGAWQTELEAAFPYPPWFAAFEPIDAETPEYEYVLAGGLKADLTFCHNRSPEGRQATLVEMVDCSPLRFVFERGARVLLDKTGSSPFPLAAPTPEPLPDQRAFDNRIACYLNELVRAVKLAGRGELWRAARAINEEMRSNLLALLEWHARARNVPGSADWPYGRFLEEWASPRALAALPATYTDSTLPATYRAVRGSLNLLAWLGPETASLIHLRYPTEMARAAAGWLLESIIE